jgi:hypothetical protein
MKVTERTLASSLPPKAAKLVKNGEEVLKDLELYIATLRHAVIHHLDDGRGVPRGDGREEGEVLERGAS